MVKYNELIDKYYSENEELKQILIIHSKSVANKALAIASAHAELNLDYDFLLEAAMLHDIGIVMTDASGIKCYGREPYIRHGVIGAELLRAEGLPRHARVCERHTGAGLSMEDIISQNLPLPHINLLPETMEEKVICYSDKFFSKTKLDKEKTVEQVERSLAKFGKVGLDRFIQWHEMFRIEN